MAQPYAFINERQQTSIELKARFDLSTSASEKFDMLNEHLRNVVVLPGQLVIVGDATTAMCTPEEKRLKQAAWSIRHSVMAEGGADLVAVCRPADANNGPRFFGLPINRRRGWGRRRRCTW